MSSIPIKVHGARGSSGRRLSKQHVVLDDDEQLIGELTEHYGEMDGRVSAARAESHPLIRGFFMLQLFIGLFGSLAVLSPLFISMSQDGVSMQLALFVIELLLAGVVAMAAHDARLEEMLFLIRAHSYGSAARLGVYIPAAMALFAACLLAQLVANMVAARVGDLSTATHVVLALGSAVTLVTAIVLVQRQRNCYILNDLVY